MNDPQKEIDEEECVVCGWVMTEEPDVEVGENGRPYVCGGVFVCLNPECPK
jgi:coenzyme F420-reducing hydrogenase beta subunit